MNNGIREEHPGVEDCMKEGIKVQDIVKKKEEDKLGKTLKARQRLEFDVGGNRDPVMGI